VIADAFMRWAMFRIVKLAGDTSPRSTSSHVHGAETGCTNSVSGGERGAVIVATGVHNVQSQRPTLKYLGTNLAANIGLGLWTSDFGLWTLDL